MTLSECFHSLCFYMAQLLDLRTFSVVIFFQTFTKFKFISTVPFTCFLIKLCTPFSYSYDFAYSSLFSLSKKYFILLAKFTKIFPHILFLPTIYQFQQCENRFRFVSFLSGPDPPSPFRKRKMAKWRFILLCLIAKAIGHATNCACASTCSFFEKN